MVEHHCETCAYYSSILKKDGSEGTEGRCKRFPPNYDETLGVGRHTKVGAGDWCGEHSALQGYWVEYHPESRSLSHLFRMLPK